MTHWTTSLTGVQGLATSTFCGNRGRKPSEPAFGHRYCVGKSFVVIDRTTTEDTELGIQSLVADGKHMHPPEFARDSGHVLDREGVDEVPD